MDHEHDLCSPGCGLSVPIVGVTVRAAEMLRQAERSIALATPYMTLHARSAAYTVQPDR